MSKSLIIPAASNSGSPALMRVSVPEVVGMVLSCILNACVTELREMVIFFFCGWKWRQGVDMIFEESGHGGCQ